MFLNCKKYFISSAMVILFLLPIFGFFIPIVKAETATEQERTDLENQLKEIEQQIADYEKQLAETKTQKNTLANKIKQLQSQQASLRLQIKATVVRLDGIEKDLQITKKDITEIIKKFDILNLEVAALLRLLNTTDQNIMMTLITSDGLGGAFIEIKNYEKLTEAIGVLVRQTKNLKVQLEAQKNKFENQQNDAESFISIKTIQQSQLTNSLGEQNSLLQETKGKESNYQTMLADKKKQATAIRNRMYELFSMTTQINFGQALEIANWASDLTGVRSAFLLAILTQESNLGKNVGTCNRVGDPPEKSWKVIMKPERDQKPFSTITEELGLDPDTTPVSCPMRDANGKQVGWGGAMGPAQFIPSTWMGYRTKVTAITGHATANPWDIRDAFIASALKLKAGGAGSGKADDEWKAAMIYFSGSTNTRYRFYGDNVMATAKKYQSDIDELNN